MVEWLKRAARLVALRCKHVALRRIHAALQRRPLAAFQRRTAATSLSQLAAAVSCLAVVACVDTQNEFTSRHCYLVIDNATHQDATLASAMTPYSGVFVTITLVNHGGAQYFRFQSNQQTSSESIFNAIDQRRSQMLGMNDGLIVGYGLLTDPPVFYGYDRECPNCYDDSRVPLRSYALQVGTNGMATCKNCQRQYDLNNGGIVVAGDAGQKLIRYRAATTGPFGVLSVN